MFYGVKELYNIKLFSVVLLKLLFMKETLFKFINRNHYVTFITFLILLISLIMYLRDFRMMTLDTWPQYIQPAFLYHHFFKSVLYFHGNPPGASIINYVANLISFGNKNAFFEIVF